jgi:hypothetical protein
MPGHPHRTQDSARPSSFHQQVLTTFLAAADIFGMVGADLPLWSLLAACVMSSVGTLLDRRCYLKPKLAVFGLLGLHSCGRTTGLPAGRPERRLRLRGGHR